MVGEIELGFCLVRCREWQKDSQWPTLSPKGALLKRMVCEPSTRKEYGVQPLNLSTAKSCFLAFIGGRFAGTEE